VPGRHYVPAWGVSMTGPDGTRIVYGGDTGPNPGLVARAGGADLLIVEATLASTEEDDADGRGHLTLDEAIEHARASGARRALITHYPTGRRREMGDRLAALDGSIALARPDLVLDVGPSARTDVADPPRRRRRPARTSRSSVGSG